MRIEELIKIPENAKILFNARREKTAIDPKNGNQIFSWNDSEFSLAARRIIMSRKSIIIGKTDDD